MNGHSSHLSRLNYGCKIECLQLSSFISPWTGYYLSKSICQYSRLGFPFCYSSFFPWACWLCWPIGPTTPFLGLSRPVCSIFTSYSSHGPAGYHSYHVGPLGLLPFSLGFPDPFTSSLPLIPPMGLLASIPTILAHWACYLFPWAFSAHLLHFYLLFLPWACWLSFCCVGPLGNNSLLPFIFLFPSIFHIVRLLLLLGLSSKVGINN